MALTGLVNLSTALIPPDQPEMVPSSVTKMKRAAPKSEPPLKTIPVGADGGTPPTGGGTVTTSASFWPAPLYSVETPVPLSATHQGLVALRARPHGLTRFGSVTGASPGISETRLVCW